MTLEPLLVTPKEACKLLSVGMTTIYQLMNSGELRKVKIGGNTRITMASITHLAEQGTQRKVTRPSPRKTKT